MQMVTFTKAIGRMVRRTAKAYSLTRQTKPSTKANGKWTNNMVKELKLGTMVNVFTKEHLNKERKLAGHDMSKTEMFTKVTS